MALCMEKLKGELQLQPISSVFEKIVDYSVNSKNHIKLNFNSYELYYNHILKLIEFVSNQTQPLINL